MTEVPTLILKGLTSSKFGVLLLAIATCTASPGSPTYSDFRAATIDFHEMGLTDSVTFP